MKIFVDKKNRTRYNKTLPHKTAIERKEKIKKGLDRKKKT
jgi:hypothetical protein